MAPTLILEAAHLLSKRDENEIGGVPKWALVFLITIGAGVLVIILYGVFRFMTPEKDVERPISAEQADYMREVRERGYNRLMADMMHKDPHRHRAPNHSYAGASTT